MVIEEATSSVNEESTPVVKEEPVVIEEILIEEAAPAVINMPADTVIDTSDTAVIAVLN